MSREYTKRSEFVEGIFSNTLKILTFNRKCVFISLSGVDARLNDNVGQATKFEVSKV